MTFDTPDPSPQLLAARRSLEGHDGVVSVGELRWVGKAKGWAFAIDLDVDSADECLVPRTTRWFVVLEPQYPWGTVTIFPSKDGGLRGTFPHQKHNHNGDDEEPWRGGELCVLTPSASLKRSGSDPDPKGTHDRVRWYVRRAQEWLACASRRTLHRVGDEFELPDWSVRTPSVGFSEDELTYSAWTRTTASYGYADLVRLPGSQTFAVRRFYDNRGVAVVEPRWGHLIGSATHSERAGWIRLPALPVLEPYAAPMTWGDLVNAGVSQGVDVDALLQSALSHLRDGLLHLLLVGFPIPRRFGELPSRLHWQAASLPLLSHGIKPRNGFSASAKGYWQGDRATVLRDPKRIAWLDSSNWSAEQIGTRGQLSAALRSQNVVLLGCGSLGSTLAEILVRGGVTRLRLFDGESLRAGNLVRHTLSLTDVGRPKAERLAQRLNSLTPHALVESVSEDFDPLASGHLNWLREATLVIDATGSDDVLAALAHAPRTVDGLYCSVSIGRGARRLYMYSAFGSSFPAAVFHEALAPWLARDREEFAELDHPWEGIGCWHPVFPVVFDRVSAFASAAVSMLNHRVQAGLTTSGLDVLEATEDTGALKKVSLNA